MASRCLFSVVNVIPHSLNTDGMVTQLAEYDAMHEGTAAARV